MTKLDENKLLDQLVDRKYNPEELLAKMKANIAKKYSAKDLREKGAYLYLKENDPIFGKRKQETIKDFKNLMQGLIASGLPRKVELGLIILEDIIVNFMNPYTRELLLERINEKKID